MKITGNSTIDGMTVEEITATGEGFGDYFRRRLEETGGVMTLTQNGKTYTFKGVTVSETVSEIEGGVTIEELPLRFERVKVGGE